MPQSTSCWLIFIFNVFKEFGNRCFFKDINFYGHAFFRTISDNCFRVTFIPGSENHKLHDSFSFIFSIYIKLFSWIWGVVFLNFLKNYDKETAWWSLYFVTPQVCGSFRRAAPLVEHFMVLCNKIILNQRVMC